MLLSPVSDKDESLPLVVPVINSAETNMPKALKQALNHVCGSTKASVSAVLLGERDHSLCEQPDAQHLPILGAQSHGPDVAHSLLDGTWLGAAAPQK